MRRAPAECRLSPSSPSSSLAIYFSLSIPWTHKSEREEAWERNTNSEGGQDRCSQSLARVLTVTARLPQFESPLVTVNARSLFPSHEDLHHLLMYRCLINVVSQEYKCLKTEQNSNRRRPSSALNFFLTGSLPFVSFELVCVNEDVDYGCFVPSWQRITEHECHFRGGCFGFEIIFSFWS